MIQIIFLFIAVLKGIKGFAIASMCCAIVSMGIDIYENKGFEKIGTANVAIIVLSIIFLCI